MISIIISSYKPDLFTALEKNIAETIGVPYEIIKIENPGLMGICEAYNKGAERSKFENLLFLHEDVKFKNFGWGEKLSKYLEIQNIGLVGLAGATHKFDMCYGYDSMLPELGFLFVQDKNGNTKSQTIIEKPIKVKTIDGVFIAMKNQHWQKLKFDESIKGFHFYDIDISMRSSQTAQNIVCDDIELIHFSNGKFDNVWMNSCLHFSKRKYSNYDVPTTSQRKRVRNAWYKRLKTEDISFINRLKYIFSMGTDKHSFGEMKNFLFKK